MEQSIAILILFYNKLEQTKECINSFLPCGFKIYVLNNGSELKQWKNLQSEYAHNSSVALFDAGKNLGPSGGRNHLIKHTDEPWLVFADSDIIIKPKEKWGSIFFDFLEKFPDARIVCPRIFNVHENEYMDKLQMIKKGNYLSTEIRSNSKTNYFPEGGVVVHRSIFKTYGLYDEKLFSFEGYEYALRAMISANGEFEVYHIDEIELIHHHQYQKSNSDRNAVRQRYNEEKLKASYDHIIAKYKIVFEHEWQWWSAKQVEEMTKKNWVKRIKKVLKKMFG